jgi:hypothetical protein
MAGRLADIDSRKIFLVQLSDFMWREVRSPEDRIDTARHSRVSERVTSYARGATRRNAAKSARS